jgi:P27 family predicted phage terminase small subunit
MAKPGPKPKPTRLKILTGNPGCRPLPTGEPQPEVGLPRCPARFKGDARKLWNQFARQLTACGIATKLDATALEMLVDQHQAYTAASAQVLKTGPVWLERGEGTIPKFAYSPYWVQQQRAFKHMLAMLREFGMTPSGRASVKSAAPLVENKDDPAARYFG